MQPERADAETDRSTATRRTLLRTAAGAGAAAGGIGLAGTAGADRGNDGGDDAGNGDGNDEDDGNDGGFPPSGITEYGRSVRLGNGEARPFTTETPSGEPLYHGVEIDRDAFSGLPTADELASADNQAETDKYRESGQALQVHFKWSLEFFVPFPDAANTPFTFLGLNWNPGGHPPPGVYTVPHFDVHFHMLDPATIDAITGPRAPEYDGIPADLIPEGYVRTPKADERVITDMGEHLVPVDAPELNGGEFTNTLIQGFVDADGDGTPRLAFVEPMLTREYLRDLSGVDERTVPQPETYPTDQQHPTSYGVRDLPSKDALAVVVQDFE